MRMLIMRGRGGSPCNEIRHDIYQEHEMIKTLNSSTLSTFQTLQVIDMVSAPVLRIILGINAQ